MLWAAVLVARQPGVDADRVGLLSYGEGGWVVPLAAERSPSRIAFMILVSAPVVSPVDQAAWTTTGGPPPSPTRCERRSPRSW